MAQGEFIEILSSDALASLKTANDEVTKLIANINKAGESMKAIKTPSQSDGAIKNLGVNYDKQVVALKNLQIEVDKARVSEIKLQQAREKSVDSYNKGTAKQVQAILNQSKSYQALEAQKTKAIAQSAKETAEMAKLENAYERVKAKINSMLPTYNDLKTKSELGIKLNSKEEAQLILLEKRLTKYRETLNSVNKSYGNYSLEVGNYAKGTSNLSNAIGQISRELPNFGQSFQIGVLSLTNNIGALQDSIKQVKLQNKELKAQGLETTSVMKQIGSSILSFNTALYVGIGLFSAYSKEIAEWVSSLFEGNKELKELAENQKKFNNARFDGVKDAQSEIFELKKYLSVVKDRKISDEERNIALKKLRSEYPFYFKNLTDEQILLGQSTESVNKLMTALEKRKEIEKKSELSVTNKQKLLDLQSELDIQIKLQKQAQANLDRGVKNGDSAQALAFYSNDLNKATQKRIELSKSMALISDAEIKNDADIFKLKKETIALEYQEEKASKTKVAQKKKEAEQLKQFTEDWFQAEISRLEAVRGKVADTTDEYASYTNQINVLKQLLKDLQGVDSKDTLSKDQLKALEDGIKGMKSYEETVVKTKEETDKLRKSTDEWIKSFQDGFFADAGLPTLLKVLNGEITGFGKNFTETFLAISQISQEALEFMTQSSNAYFENQLYQLAQQRDVAIAFAGDSAVAREEIERQYDEKQRQLKRQQAKEQQKIALFNIAIDTAQAIVASFKTDPTGFLAGIIGAIGILQASIVASTPIPEFYKGTDNAPEGWAYTQEKGAEIITDKNGKVKSLGSNKGAELTYLNKGDKVFTAQESQMMFNNDLNNILVGNGIMMPKVEVNMDTQIITNEIKSLARTIANKESFTIVENDRGRKVYQRKQAETKELLNNVLTIKGYEV